nr:MAG TPA: hypothetical protein [Bacteriophage sp.]
MSFKVRTELQNSIIQAFEKGISVEESQAVIESLLRNISEANVDDSVKTQAYA